MQERPQPALLHFAVAWGAASHIVAQSPQWLGSVVVLTHAPPQFWVPAVQVEVHLPPVQTSFCPQALPQAPQFEGSESVRMHAPPHIAKPTSQVAAHLPELHVALPFAGALHT